MKNIPLCVLDEYAKRLTDSQVNRLYEAKTHKTYKKALYENSASKYSLYLDTFVLATELGCGKAEFLTKLNEAAPTLLERVSYKTDADAITFVSKDRPTYSLLLETLNTLGMDEETIKDIRDTKY